MSTWWWVLVWVVLVLAALGYLATKVWALWGKVTQLTGELATAQERMEGVQGELELLGEQMRDPSELAVFSTPAQLRQQRDGQQRNQQHRNRQQSIKRSLSRRNRARRASSSPSRVGDVH